jgi:predicted dienelactone hydrolase
VLTDHQRSEPLAGDTGPRRLSVRVWYPAAARAGAPAAVLTPAEQAGLAGDVGLEPGALDGLGSAATAAAPAAPGRHPVLLLSPGLGETTGLQSAHAADLASHGYVVVGVDVPGDTFAVDLGDGELVPRHIFEASAETIALRTRDLRFVLGKLESLRGIGRIDRDRIGAFGHSNGGATAADLMLVDRRIRAGVNIDGGIYGPVMERGLDRPLGIMMGDALASMYSHVREFRSRLRGPRPLVDYPGVMHHGFADNVWLVPQLGFDPVAGDVGTVDAATAVQQQNAWLRRFFDRQMRG